MRILVVDDREENLYLLKYLLEGKKHEVLTAPNGVAALDVLGKGDIDLIISDILMPEMDGFQLVRKVRTSEALQSIPIIIHTATYTGKKDEEFALRIGANRFVEKPCDPDVLLEIIRDVTSESNATPTDLDGMPIHESEALKLYSERLVRKLEQKVQESDLEIKARIAAEYALRESESRLLEAQRLAGQGDFSWDLENGEIKWSTPLYEMLGHDTSENFDIDDINTRVHHPEDLEGITTWLRQALESKSERLPPHEYRVRRRDGETLVVRTVGKIHRRNGEKPKVFATVQDITERRKVEEEKEKLRSQLFQAQKMETVGRLAGGVAHDINNMLSVILGFTELSLEELEPGSPLHQNLTEVQKASIRTSEITRQLLSFARKQIISPRLLDLNKAVEENQRILTRFVGENARLEWAPGRDVWPILMDPAQVVQILINLCINARDAIDGNGVVCISTDRQSFGPDNPPPPGEMEGVAGDFVVLSISDNGAGMESDTLANLFEPFFTTKGVGKGTGLGLSSVYGIVKQNKGYIQVESEQGVGTTFRIYLPRHEVDETDAAAVNDQIAPVGGNETILVVEDQAPNLKMETALLEQLGYKVLGTNSPREAIEWVGAIGEDIHLLLTDVVMPEMNGMEMAGMIKKIRPEIRVLFMSGYSADVIPQQGAAPLGIHFLAKPFTLKGLASKVREILDSPGE